MLKQEIGELLEKRLICRTVNEQQELSFLPGVPPENFTLLAFLDAVNGRGDAETAEFARFDRALADMEAQLEKSNLNMRIIDIK